MQKVLFLFAEINDDDIDWMISTGKLAIVPSGTVLIEQNKPIDSLYILLKGQVSVSVTDGEHTTNVAELSSGEIFGEMSFIDSALPSATVTTSIDSEILSVSREKLATRLNEDIGFASRFYRAMSIFLSSRLRKTMKYIDYDKQGQISIDRDEIGAELQQSVPFAKARYDWLLRHFENLVS